MERAAGGWWVMLMRRVWKQQTVLFGRGDQPQFNETANEPCEASALLYAVRFGRESAMRPLYILRIFW
jgi:hypothetical protein